jgi:HD-GYP domain-containing protein (c-di-GMP phosphodiesterase class II)
MAYAHRLMAALGGDEQPVVQEVLEQARERIACAPARRERLVDGALAAAFVVAALAAALALPHEGVAGAGLALGLVACLVIADHVEFEVGSGVVTPSVVVLIPMTLLLPPALLPAAIGAGLVASRAVAAARREIHPGRVLLAPCFAWFCLGPALVMAIAEPGTPTWDDWPVWLAVALAQLAGDGAALAAREPLSVGVPLRVVPRTLVYSAAVDALLAPVGLFAAIAIAEAPLAAALVLPPLALLAIFSGERRARFGQAIELSRAYRGTALLLGDVVEADDEYTGAHSRNVVELAVDVAAALGLDAHARRTVEMAALLHDVGKIAVPKTIINKPGPLDDAEWEIMRRHTLEGERMLASIGGALTEVGRIVRSSHERVDGGGYPDGLRGDEIPLEARIVCCCDAFSAMTTDRSYRRAMPQHAALDELRAHAGTQFDARVAAALVALVERDAPPALSRAA